MRSLKEYERLTAGLPQQVAQFRFLIVRIYRDQNRSYLRRGEHEHDPLRAVGSPQRYLLPLTHADRHQPPGGGIDPLRKLPPRPAHPGTGMDDGFPQGERLDGGIENLTKRQFPHSKLFHGNSTRPWNAEKPPALLRA